ncbi:MAG: hypothetical protein JSV39_01900 [Candidatus Aenigmatarchaeota archaeon]|nr:MAG: hypothetical protein JSV39_01900 [Candidatus Aenigmarchaeota archaeon]
MFREIRTNFGKLSGEGIEIERFSKDFRIRISIDFSKKHDSVGSGLKFVDSILKNTNFSVEVSKEGPESRELIENVGFAFGEGLRKLHERRGAKFTSSLIRSDKKMTCMFAIHVLKQLGEANIQIIGKPEFDPDQLFAFFDGFSQGFRSEVEAVINLGKEKNHLESVSRAFAGSLGQMFGE